jgi:hypothetical protein
MAPNWKATTIYFFELSMTLDLDGSIQPIYCFMGQFVLIYSIANGSKSNLIKIKILASARILTFYYTRN